MTLAMRHADYGQRWGEGAARYFYIEGDLLDDSQDMRLMPVPDSFVCPISAAIMTDPVATVDGCAYEREYIERWFRERRQQRQSITSPATGLELMSTTLMPLFALRCAIESYLAHRPELKDSIQARRSFEEAAQALQADLLEKQAMHASVHDEMRRLREANRALRRALERSEERYGKVLDELLNLKGVKKQNANKERAKDEGSKNVSASECTKPEEMPECRLSPASPEVVLEQPTRGDLSADAEPKPPAKCSSQNQGGPESPAINHTLEADMQNAEKNMARQEDAGGASTQAPPVSLGEQSSTKPAADTSGRTEELSPAIAPVGAALTGDADLAEGNSASSPQLIPTAGSAAMDGTVSALERSLPDVSRKAETQRPTATDSFPAGAIAASKSSHPPPSLGTAQAASAKSVDELKLTWTAAVTSPTGVARRAPASSLRLAASCSPHNTEERAKDASRQLPQGEPGIVARPACLPAPLSSGSENLLCSSSAAGSPAARHRADKSRPALWSGLVLLLTVCIVGFVLKLQLSHPDLRRIKGICDMFNAQALLSPVMARGFFSSSQVHRPVAADMRSEPFGQTPATDSPPVPAGISPEIPQEVEDANGAVPDLGAPSDDRELRLGPAQDSEIQAHVMKLRFGNADEKVYSATALKELAERGPAEQGAVARGGAVRLLVELLRMESRTEVRGMGAAALSAVVAGNSENQVLALRAGAVSALVKLLNAHTVPKDAAAALHRLATDNVKTQVAIVRAGAIAPLVELMSDGAPEARLEAAAALEQLARPHSSAKLYDKQVAFVQAGAIPPLVRRLHDKAAAVRRASASMLRMLATHNADNQVAIAQAGAILPLVTLLTDIDMEVRKEAAAALGFLSFFESETNFGNQAGIGQAGAIPLLVGLLQDPFPDVRAIAAGTLRDLASSNAENQIRMLNAGVTQPLLALVQSSETSVQTATLRLVRSLAGSKVPQIREEATRVLTALARNSTDRKSVV